MSLSRPRRPRHATRANSRTTNPPARMCTVCLASSNPHNVLLCQACDKAFHTYCLNPPNPNLPQDDSWTCPTCTNSATRRSQKVAASNASAPTTARTTRTTRRSNLANSVSKQVQNRQRINASTSTAASSDRGRAITRSRAKSAASVNTETDTDDEDEEDEDDEEEDDNVKDPDFTHADSSPVVATRPPSRRSRKPVVSSATAASTTVSQSPISTRGRKRRVESVDTTDASATTTRSPASKGATTSTTAPLAVSPHATIKKRKYMRRKFSNNNRSNNSNGANVSGDSLSDSPGVGVTTLPPPPPSSTTTSRVGVSPRKGRPPSRPKPQPVPKSTQPIPRTLPTKHESQKAPLPPPATTSVALPPLPQQQQNSSTAVVKSTRPLLLAEKEQALFTLARASANTRVGAAPFGRSEQMRVAAPIHRHQSSPSHQSSVNNSLVMTRPDAQRPMTASYTSEQARVQAHAHASTSLPANYRIPQQQHSQQQHQQQQQQHYYEQRSAEAMQTSGGAGRGAVGISSYYAQHHQQAAAAAVRQHDQAVQQQRQQLVPAQVQQPQQQIYATATPAGTVNYRVGSVGARNSGVPSEVSLSSGARRPNVTSHLMIPQVQQRQAIPRHSPPPPQPQPSNSALRTPLSYALSAAPKVTPIPPQYAQVPPNTQRSPYPGSQYVPQRNGVQYSPARYAQPQPQQPQPTPIAQIQTYHHRQQPVNSRANFVRQSSTQGSSTFVQPPRPVQQPSHYQYPARQATTERATVPTRSYVATTSATTYPIGVTAAPVSVVRPNYHQPQPRQQQQQAQPLYAAPTAVPAANGYNSRDSAIWRNNVTTSDSHWSVRDGDRRTMNSIAAAPTTTPTTGTANPSTVTNTTPTNDIYGKPVWQPQRLRRIDAVLPPAIRRDNFDQGRALASVSVPTPQQPSAWQSQPDLSYQLGTVNVRSEAPPALTPLPSRPTNAYQPTSTLTHSLPAVHGIAQQPGRASSFPPPQPISRINPVAPQPQARYGQMDGRRSAGAGSGAGRLPSVSSLLQ